MSMRSAGEFAELYGHLPGVPYSNEPLVWDARLPLAVNMHTIDNYVKEYARYLPVGCAFDEVALMASSEGALDQLLKHLAMLGWSVFNLAADVVHANPFSTRYAVEYVFLRHPDRPYRMEVMLLGERTASGETGFSPLHAGLWRERYDRSITFPVPHLSFKPPADLVAEVGPQKAARVVLKSMQDGPHGFIIAQACQSTYGQFWYTIPNQSARQLYIKPRINIRDHS